MFCLVWVFASSSHVVSPTNIKIDVFDVRHYITFSLICKYQLVTFLIQSDDCKEVKLNTTADKPYTLAEVADLLRVSDQTVRAEARAGRLPAVKVGRRWLFPRDSIYRFLHNGDADAK